MTPRARRVRHIANSSTVIGLRIATLIPHG
jgi:hypothetical protein